MCSTCGKLNTKKASMDTLIAHITFNQIRGTFMSTDSDQVMEISASIILFSAKPDPRWAMNIPSSHSTTLKVFPDSSVTICLGESKHLIWVSQRITLSHQERSFGQLEVSLSYARAGYLLNLWSEERQLNKPSTYARTSSSLILAGQPALM